MTTEEIVAELDKRKAANLAQWRRLTPMQQCMESRVCRHTDKCYEDRACAFISGWERHEKRMHMPPWEEAA